MPGLLRGIARTAVVAGTATAVSNGVSRRQANRWADQQAEQEPVYAPQQYAPEPTYAAPPPPPAAAPDPIEQLQQLADLKDRGILTEQEFAEQKQRILGR